MIEFSVSPLRPDCETRFLRASRRFVNQSLNFETSDTQWEVSFEDGCYLVGQSFFKGAITDASCQTQFFRQADKLHPSQQTYTYIYVL